MYLNGITLVSSVLNFEYIDFNRGNDLPYILFLPTYATTAQYHKKLSPELENMSAADLAKKAETFASGTYSYFLMKGDQASAELTYKVIDSINYFTGLSKNYIQHSNERISDIAFLKRSCGMKVKRWEDMIRAIPAKMPMMLAKAFLTTQAILLSVGFLMGYLTNMCAKN